MEDLIGNIPLYPVMKNGSVVNVGCLGSKKYVIVHSRFIVTDVCSLRDLDWTMICFYQIKDDSWIKLPHGAKYGKLFYGNDLTLSGGTPITKEGVEIGMVYNTPEYEITLINEQKTSLGGRQYHKSNTLHKCIDTFRCVIKKR